MFEDEPQHLTIYAELSWIDCYQECIHLNQKQNKFS